MSISSKEREAKKVKVLVDSNVVDTNFEKWAKPGHFSRTLSQRPKNHNVDLELTCRRP